MSFRYRVVAVENAPAAAAAAVAAPVVAYVDSTVATCREKKLHLLTFISQWPVTTAPQLLLELCAP